MYPLIALIAFFFFPGLFVLVRNIFHATYIWQIKEYRVDRIRSHLQFKEEESIRDHSINLLQYALFITSLVFFVQPANAFLVVPVLAFASYWVECLNVIQSFTSKKLIRPKKSIRNLLIVAFSFFILILPILIPMNFVRNIYNDSQHQSTDETKGSEPVTVEDFLIQENIDDKGEKTIPLVFLVLISSSLLMISADFVSPLVVSFFAIVTEPLAQIKRRRLISAAKKRISKHKEFKTIAITGSYGKTTTKEILYELIKDNFKTAKTRENFNSPVGIAQEVLNGLNPDTEVFIAEMGAYRQGEIEASTNILPPDISIVTSIGPQHISLFGSLEKIIKAKFEIIKNLKEDGLAIFNANNVYCVEMAAKTDKSKTMYYVIDEEISGTQIKGEAAGDTTNQGKTERNSNSTQMLYALNIKETKNGFTLDLKQNNKTYPAQFMITGLHNISNLLAAVAAAQGLGMDLPSIASKIRYINLPDLRLSWKQGINSTEILDDSYNSNLEGFSSALKVLTKSKVNKQGEKTKRSKTILITRGIIELGREKREAYKKLAIEIGQTVDLVITSDKELIDAVKINSDKTKVEYAHTFDEFYNKIISSISENDIILLEGRLPPVLIEQIIQT